MMDNIKIDYILEAYGYYCGDDCNDGGMNQSEAKQTLAKLFHEAVPEKRGLNWGCTGCCDNETGDSCNCYREQFNEAIDQTHKNIDEMFK